MENKESTARLYMRLSIIFPFALIVSYYRFSMEGCVGFGAGGTLCGTGAKYLLYFLVIASAVAPVCYFLQKKKDK